MVKRLYQMTWDEVQAEMSIAGSPDKMRKMGEDVLKIVESALDPTNLAEYINAEFALQRIIVELRMLERWERERQHPKKSK